MKANHKRSKARQKPYRSLHRKRGMVLLVVVSLITLFLLIGITFAVVAINYKDAAVKTSQIDLVGDNYEHELDNVFRLILRDSKSPPVTNPAVRSSLTWHSLLMDVYGVDGVAGRVTSVASENNGQVIHMIADRVAGRPTPYLRARGGEQFAWDPQGDFSFIPDFYTGRVLTFTSGQGTGVSTRVMKSERRFNGTTMAWDYHFWVAAPDASTDLPSTISVVTNDEWIINGAPFNGTGFGLEPGATPNLDKTFAFPDPTMPGMQLQMPVALFPNYQGYSNSWTVANTGGRPNGVTVNEQVPILGGPDEGYDAPDFQNMLLALVPANVAADPANLPIFPSMHRPDLIRYLRTVGIPFNTPANEYRNLRRAAIFRPMPWDHPEFTGSNPAFQGAAWTQGADMAWGKAMVDDDGNGTTDDESEKGWFDSDDELQNDRAPYPMMNPSYPSLMDSLVNGPWDVDNDGDGVPDSIWIDPGLPVMTAPNGRKIKRLFAIMVRDLDGRVNLNTASNGQLVPTGSPDTNTNRAAVQIVNVPNLAGVAAGSGQTITIPRGFGFGPAEIDFAHLFNRNQTVAQQLVQSRYGRIGGTQAPGLDGQRDYFWYMKSFGLPGAFNDSSVNVPFGNAYGSPADVYGRAGLALDYYGQPLYTANAGSAEQTDPPYEMQTDARRARNDRPYTAAELERVLRHRDGDASSLPRRVLDMATDGTNKYLENFPNSLDAERARKSITTISSHIPVPATPALSTMREHSIPTTSVSSGTQGLPPGMSSLLFSFYQRMGAGNDTNFRKMVAWELRHGGLFNLNRPFGNGKHDQTTVDNNAGFGVVDDPSEWLLGFTAMNPYQNGQYDTNVSEKLYDSAGNLTIPFWHRGDEPLPSYADPRQLYCRHLYCLMMLLLPNQPFDLGERDSSNNPILYSRDSSDPNSGRPAYSRKIAQWVVNVVDFRDPDSINTAFEYDINPFDGWHVDDNIATDDNSTTPGTRGVVWGTERPELLITETLATHDRRTEDLPVGNRTDHATAPDEDFDQRLRPVGNCFIELFNPWFNADGRDVKPVELYNNTGNIATNGVNLARVAPGGAPVWRILVVAGNSRSSTTDPDAANDTVGMPAGPNHNPLPERIPSSDVVRSIYFADPTALTTAGAVHGSPFYTNIPFAPILPGRYAVVGSSGIAEDEGGDNKYVSVFGRHNPTSAPATTRRIELKPNVDPTVTNQVRVMDNLADTTAQTPNENNDVAFAQAANAVAIVINRRCLGGGAASDRNQSLSLTEPVGGYIAAGDPDWDSMQADAVNDNDGQFTSPKDTPLDKARGDTEPGYDWWAGGSQTSLLIPSGTKAAFRTLHLQRLANPLLPWNVDTNPYLTVDSSSVDLHAFNGVTNGKNERAESVTQAEMTTNFQTFQRGGSWAATGTTATTLYPTVAVPPPAWDGTGGIDGAREFWRRSPPRPSNPTSASPDEATLNPPLTATHFHNYPLFHTLGYLNSRYQPHFRLPDGAGAYTGAPNSGPTSPIREAFPWLSFLNRPFNSPAELLLVPTRSQSQFLRSDQRFGQSVYSEGGPAVTAIEPFKFLLNPFHSETGSKGEAPAHFSRLFDYVETRSPFQDQEQWFNPATGYFGGQSTGMGTIYQHDGTAGNGYRPPFNYLSRFRDAGRLNINTAFDSTGGDNRVLSSIFQQFTPLDTNQFRGEVMKSLRGDGTTDLSANSGRPALIGNPFRASDLAGIGPNTPNMRQTRPVDSTALRTVQNPGGGPRIPLFSAQLGVNAGVGVNINYWDKAARNPYFEYQPLQNVYNKITSQSNCYAIWITVGYFEADWTGATNYVYPDGYRLGAEVGADTGEIKRHKAFYIVDRSIPVGFEPGEDHNVDKCVLLRRIIE